jgi:uncharacterized protein YdeI (YjbR/CyaY-like superfamily)
MSATSPPTASDHPASWKFGYPIFHPEARAAWRAWLAANHDVHKGVWVCSWKAATGRPAVPYAELVEEALCWGWVDSTINTLDEARSLILVARRKPKSTWTRLNRRRVAEMEAAGQMTEAGRRAVAVAQENGWWTILDPVEDLLEPDDLAAALDAEPAARASWDAFPASPRKAMLWWVISAVKPETRAARVARVVAEAAEGRRAQG